MTFDELYARAIERWPDEVEVSDGHATGPRGVRFPTLTRVNDEIEASLTPDDRWGRIAAWSLFQAFHSEAKRILSAGGSSVRTREVDKQDIDRCVRSNLEPSHGDDTWAEERAVYRGIGLR